MVNTVDETPQDNGISRLFWRSHVLDQAQDWIPAFWGELLRTAVATGGRRIEVAIEPLQPHGQEGPPFSSEGARLRVAMASDGEGFSDEALWGWLTQPPVRPDSRDTLGALVCFGQDRYEIHTNGLVVEGQGSAFRVEPFAEALRRSQDASFAERVRAFSGRSGCLFVIDIPAADTGEPMLSLAAARLQAGLTEAMASVPPDVTVTVMPGASVFAPISAIPEEKLMTSQVTHTTVSFGPFYMHSEGVAKSPALKNAARRWHPKYWRPEGRHLAGRGRESHELLAVWAQACRQSWEIVASRGDGAGVRPESVVPGFVICPSLPQERVEARHQLLPDGRLAILVNPVFNTGASAYDIRRFTTEFEETLKDNGNRNPYPVPEGAKFGLGRLVGLAVYEVCRASSAITQVSLTEELARVAASLDGRRLAADMQQALFDVQTRYGAKRVAYPSLEQLARIDGQELLTWVPFAPERGEALSMPGQAVSADVSPPPVVAEEEVPAAALDFARWTPEQIGVAAANALAKEPDASGGRNVPPVVFDV